MTTMADFWQEITKAGYDKFLQKPYVAFNYPIYGISTNPGFIFDDGFWDIFHSFHFHICHVTTLVNEDENFGLNRVFDLRFREVIDDTSAPSSN